MREFFRRFRFYSDRRYSTIAGTLVYFLLMSVAPFLFWLTLIAGKIDFSLIISHELFSAIEPLLTYMQTAASEATGSAGIILLVTSLWSSTNFFYHLRRSGEIIYNTDKSRSGLRLRLSSLAVVFALILVIAATAAVPVFSFAVLNTFMPSTLAEIITLTFIVLFAFIAAYLLNVFACPYKLGFDLTIGGVTLTVTLWIVFAVGFSIYLKFSDPTRLYGALATLIVFLFWSYLMVNSLVIGIIYNGRFSGLIRERAIINLPPYAEGRNKL